MDPRTLNVELTALEEQPRYGMDLDEWFTRAADIEAAAAAIGATDLELRAQLLRADLVGRRGDVITSGQICRQVNAWAADHGHLLLLTLSHLRLSPYFGQLGDYPTALEHALGALEAFSRMGEGASPYLRWRCVMALADALADVEDIEGARQRYAEAERLSVTLGDIRARIRVFNNLAYTEQDVGDSTKAEVAVERILRLAAEYDLTLDYNTLDTVANVQLGAGRYEDAITTLLPVLDDEYASAYEEVGSRALCLVTLSQVYRRAGDLAKAQDAVDRCRHLCEDRQLSGVAVEMRREQAEIWADAGRFAEALDEYKAFHAAAMALTSSERDARAKTLHAMYEADEARRAGARAQELSLRDPLTGLFNRRFVDVELPVLLGQAQEAHTPLSIAIVDLDHFKRINDTCSHEVGDQVLRRIAELLTDAAAPVKDAFAARLGGEEFLLVLPGADPEEAYAWAERLRMAIRGQEWRPITGTVPVTASIGVATSGESSRTQEALLRLADTHLYAAKESGRDRTADGPFHLLKQAS
ncbi:diguanylate cyclase [Actinoplanes sp. HUAS TT8]|uniref:GGDEF domain-containing protein n=1 Tax=Actinoplanes sp. HUAS TT8 TaxID=3447453 RepID=UPI003F51DC93